MWRSWLWKKWKYICRPFNQSTTIIYILTDTEWLIKKSVFLWSELKKKNKKKHRWLSLHHTQNTIKRVGEIKYITGNVFYDLEVALSSHYRAWGEICWNAPLWVVVPDFDLIWERDIHLLHPQVRRHDLVLQVLKQSFKIN